MATIYRGALDGPDGFLRPVALKRLKPELGRDPTFVRMLSQEARLYARLNHPGIVQVHELERDGDELFLAMELLDGIDLGRLLDHCKKVKKAVPVSVACFVMSEVATALHYAHTLTDAEGRALHVVHRDVSPSNVMLTWSGAVKLLDFGIAKAASHAHGEQTKSGVIRGKISYFSPEQADGLELDGRSDVFALGIVFHEMLTQKRLFRGNDDFDTLRRVREGRHQPPSVGRVEVEPELDEVIGKMLERIPDERFASADEVVVALKPILHRLHGDADELRRFLVEVDPPKASPLADAPTIPDPPSRTPSYVDRVKHRPLLSLAVALLLVALAAGVDHFVRARAAIPDAVPASAVRVDVPPTEKKTPPPEVVPPHLATATPTPGARKKPASRPGPHAGNHALAPNGIKDPFKK